jgi:DNA-binding SARP family transcriptional activator
LTSRLLDPASYRVAQVIAPAGSGKSRLLIQTAYGYPGPVAWCGTPDPVPRTESALVDLLWDGLTPALNVAGDPASGIQGMVQTLSVPGPTVLVVIDDLHLLEGSEAERAMAALIDNLPHRLRIVLASRVDLGFDVSRLRVSGELVEIGHDDLRFRTWEVEELFRDIYGEPMIPEDVAVLTRRTSGWAAFLQLFHLATSNHPPAERHRLLAGLSQQPRLVQEYLTRHVLAGLPHGVQEFLIRTSVLRRPTGALCDELLGRSTGGAEVLAGLERCQIFTERVDSAGYRYHSVLQTHLEARLVESIGAEAARVEHRRAALLLEREGLAEEAATAFAKAEEWEGVARMLGDSVGASSLWGGDWLELLPPTVVEGDALLLMARARRALARGAVAETVTILRKAERVAASSEIGARCRTERDRCATWCEPSHPPGSDWVGVIRQATMRDPSRARRLARELPGLSGRFAEGVVALIAGDMLDARRIFRGVTIHPEAAPAFSAGARLLGLVAGALCGSDPDSNELCRLREEVDQLAIPWLSRITQVIVAAGRCDLAEVAEVVSDACLREDDRWGEALVALIGGCGQLRSGRSAGVDLARASDLFDKLGADVLATLARAYLALAVQVDGDMEEAIRIGRSTRTKALAIGADAIAGIAELALGRAFEGEREYRKAQRTLEPLGTWQWHENLAMEPGQALSVGLPDPAERSLAHSEPDGSGARSGAAQRARIAGDQDQSSSPASTILRCLGTFSLVVGGRPINETFAKPKERALLHMLVTRPGMTFHRETIIEALWPETDPEVGRHRLHVAISAVRRLLGDHPDGELSLLVREGDAYRLTLPDQADVDLWLLELQLGCAARAQEVGQTAGETEALAGALETYRGPLLPSDGPATWVVEERALLDTRVATAAARLAQLHIDNGCFDLAGKVARTGLAIDRYRDELWNLRIVAAQRAGHQAEASTARQSYERLLIELGV